MTIGQSMLGEFDQEMQNTRKVLERVPEEKWNWKPHDKSGTVGWLAGHIATLPGWITMTINTEELDYAPVNGPSYQPPKTENRKDVLAVFDKESSEARAALAAVSDQEMLKGWKLLAGGQEIFTMPRVACIRGMVMNHLIHHRGALRSQRRRKPSDRCRRHELAAERREENGNAEARRKRRVGGRA
jgi:uncharacterized damage-inducible protein DinB